MSTANWLHRLYGVRYYGYMFLIMCLPNDSIHVTGYVKYVEQNEVHLKGASVE